MGHRQSSASWIVRWTENHCEPADRENTRAIGFAPHRSRVTVRTNGTRWFAVEVRRPDLVDSHDGKTYVRCDPERNSFRYVFVYAARCYRVIISTRPRRSLIARRCSIVLTGNGPPTSRKSLFMLRYIMKLWRGQSLSRRRLRRVDCTTIHLSYARIHTMSRITSNFWDAEKKKNATDDRPPPPPSEPFNTNLFE